MCEALVNGDGTAVRGICGFPQVLELCPNACRSIVPADDDICALRDTVHRLVGNSSAHDSCDSIGVSGVSTALSPTQSATEGILGGETPTVRPVSLSQSPTHSQQDQLPPSPAGDQLPPSPAGSTSAPLHATTIWATTTGTRPTTPPTMDEPPTSSPPTPAPVIEADSNDQAYYLPMEDLPAPVAVQRETCFDRCSTVDAQGATTCKSVFVGLPGGERAGECHLSPFNGGDGDTAELTRIDGLTAYERVQFVTW